MANESTNCEYKKDNLGSEKCFILFHSDKEHKKRQQNLIKVIVPH